MVRVRAVRMVGTFSRWIQMPRSLLPEFAFLGRSNVGKSSLINLLLDWKIARVSRDPGCTRFINLYHVVLEDVECHFVDLPGYGYARRSRQERILWGREIQEYLRKRIQLFLLFLLIDIRIPPQTSDQEVLLWLGKRQIPFGIVFTKSDALSRHELQQNLTRWNQWLSHFWEELPPWWITSSRTGAGRMELLEHIHNVIRTSWDPEQMRASLRKLSHPLRAS